jgi:hypothetical protein
VGYLGDEPVVLLQQCRRWGVGKGLGKSSPLSRRPRVEDEQGGSLGTARRSYRGRTRCDGGGRVGDVTDLSG